jgi:hypothetical protein
VRRVPAAGRSRPGTCPRVSAESGARSLVNEALRPTFAGSQRARQRGLLEHLASKRRRDHRERRREQRCFHVQHGTRHVPPPPQRPPSLAAALLLEPERTPAVYRQPPTAPDLEIAGRSWGSSCPSTETGGVHASGRGHSLTLLSARHAAAGPTARPAPRAVGAVSGASLRVVLRSASSLRYRRGEHVLALQQVLAHAYAWGDGQIAAAGDRRPLLRVGSRGRARGAVHGGC